MAFFYPRVAGSKGSIFTWTWTWTLYKNKFSLQFFLASHHPRAKAMTFFTHEPEEDEEEDWWLDTTTTTMTTIDRKIDSSWSGLVLRPHYYRQDWTSCIVQSIRLNYYLLYDYCCCPTNKCYGKNWSIPQAYRFFSKSQIKFDSWFGKKKQFSCWFVSSRET